MNPIREARGLGKEDDELHKERTFLEVKPDRLSI
jgi:hypothetical protein